MQKAHCGVQNDPFGSNWFLTGTILFINNIIKNNPLESEFENWVEYKTCKEDNFKNATAGTYATGTEKRN